MDHQILSDTLRAFLDNADKADLHTELETLGTNNHLLYIKEPTSVIPGYITISRYRNTHRAYLAVTGTSKQRHISLRVARVIISGWIATREENERKAR